MTTNQPNDGVPVFYAIDPLEAYPEPVGTDDKIERSNGALWVHLNGKRSKLIGLQSLDFLINQLVQIKGEVFGTEPAAQPQSEPVTIKEAYEEGFSDGDDRYNWEGFRDELAKAWPVSDACKLYAEQPAPVAVVPQVVGRVYTDDGVTKCELNSAGRALPDHTPLVVGWSAPPGNCRQRLAREGKPYPRSSCGACGQFSPLHKECDALLGKS